MKKKLTQLFSAAYLAQGGGILNNSAFDKVKEAFGVTGGTPAGAQSFADLVFSVVQILLLVAGSVAVVYIIYGGYNYVISRGNEESLESAKKTLKYAIFGLAIIILSFAVVRIIASVLLSGTGGLGIPG